jgi:hypothetical protein
MNNLSHEEIVRKNRRKVNRTKRCVNALSWFFVIFINLVAIFALHTVIRLLWVGTELVIDGYVNMSIADIIFACILTSIIYYNACTLVLKHMSKKDKK